MACIDKNCARKLVEKHREMFEKMASGKASFRDCLKKSIERAYIVLLVIRLVLLGSIWWLLASIDQMYGVFYLLLLAFVQAKKLLDAEFVDVESNITEAAAEAGIGNTSKVEEVESNDKKDPEESCEKDTIREDQEDPKTR